MRRRYLVVHANAVVREDLKEFLELEGWGDVDLRSSLGETWKGPYHAAFFGCRTSEVLHDPRVRKMNREGTKIAIIGGDVPAMIYRGTGIHLLEMPFRSEDIASLLNRMGISIPL